MPYAVIEPSGCGTHKDRAKLRIDLFLEVGDPNYDKAHAFVVDETCPEFLAGYQGKLDAEGNPDPVVYDKWRDGLPHVWRDNPFHSHFIYPDKDATDAEIKAQIERVRDYFYTFHQQCWDNEVPFIEDWKKVPKVKGSIRDIFVKGDSKDLSVNQAKVSDILSRQADFWIGKTSIIPPPLNIGDKGTIDIGPAAINRASYDSGYTNIALDNPANADGTIDTFEVWAYQPIPSCKAGTFYLVSGTDYKCRDSESLGTVGAGSKKTFTGLTCDVVTNDLAGCYVSGGGIEYSPSGYAGVYGISGDYADANDQATYSLYAGDAMSLYGTGTESGGGETLYGQAILAGVGSTTILAKKISRGAVLFEGVGNLTAIGNAIAAQVTLYGQALLAGVGNLTVLGKRTLKGTTTLAGVGNLTASAKKILRGTTILAGVGNLTTVGKKVLRGVSVLAGVGTLTAVGKTTKGGKVVLAGVGTLTATGYSKVIRKVISLSVKLHSRALSVALHGRSLTAKLYSRSLSTLLHKRSLDTKLKDRSITVKTRSKV